MGKAKRWLVRGLLLLPVVVLSSALVVSHAWLNYHLNRELAFGDFHLRLSKPSLGWNLKFVTDSLALESPSISIKTTRVDAHFSLWHSLLDARPTLSIVTDTLRVRLLSDAKSDSAAAEKKRRRASRPPAFPNVRLPIPFRVEVGHLGIAKGDTDLCALEKVLLASQGPKGIQLDVAEISGRLGPSDTNVFRLAAAYRVSGRWFGKSLRYQARVNLPNGDYFHVEGERRKTDLRLGRDSAEVYVAALDSLAQWFPELRLPALERVQLGFSDASDSTLVLRARIRCRTPAVFPLGPHAVDLQGNLEDTSGALVLSAKGDSGESASLRGQVRVPNLKSADWKTFAEKITGSFTGYTRNYHLEMGIRVLPGDMEIRKLTLQKGLLAEAEIKTKDSSFIKAKAFRIAGQGIKGRPDSTAGKIWKCTFTGTIDPRESWATAWTDTFVSYHDANVTGEVRNGEVSVDAWVHGAKAYGAEADSVYASQVIRKTGYYLIASRVYWKDAVWPVIGQVEWAGREKGPGRHHKVTLDFHARHPRYGYLDYSMPRRGYMEARVENAVVDHIPYVRLQPVFRYTPVVTGGFNWDIENRYGNTDLRADVIFAEEKLNLSLRGKWDAGILDLSGLELAFEKSKLKLSGQMRLGGRQFYALKGLGWKDLHEVALEADQFDAARLITLFGPGYPIEKGILNGKLSYNDSTGLKGTYAVEHLDLIPLRKMMGISHLALTGEGNRLMMAARTDSPEYPWLNDSIGVKVTDLLGMRQGVEMRVVSADGAAFAFQGQSDNFKDLAGAFALEGNLPLPGEGGQIKDFRLQGRMSAPLQRDFLHALALDSTTFHGRYGVAGIDTQTFNGSIVLGDGRLRVPDFKAVDPQGLVLAGEAECKLSGPLQVTARLRGESLSLQVAGLEKLQLKDLDAGLTIDSAGLAAEAKVGKAEFTTSRAPTLIKGELENISVAYQLPPAPKESRSGVAVASAPIPQLRLKARMRDFLFQHRIGFREVQKFFRTVKVDKRKKRIKPMDLQINLETAGAENRIETDILRMNFTGDLAVKGVYPYTLLTGEFSALSGEVGQSSQAYDVSDFDLKWQNSTLDEGRISLEGRKRLRSDCKPDTKRMCNVSIKLDGRLDEMGFTYDSDCGLNQGEAIDPTALINSVSRGCYTDEYVAGSGGANYGEAVFNFLEPTINEKLSSVGNKVSLGWIKTTQVTGIGTVVSGDTASEPIAIGVESKEKWGMSVKAKAGYHPDKRLQNPWENKVSLEWRPPLEKVATTSKWKKRVQDRVTLEASAETRPEERLIDENNNQVRKQVGVSYRYKFWDLW